MTGWRAAVAVMSVAALVAGCRTGQVAQGHPVASPSSNTTTPASTSSAPSQPTSPPVDPRAAATRRLAAIARGLPAGAISVAVLNTGTGAQFSWGQRAGMWTGSDYKLLVLEALLLQRQHSGGLSSADLADVVPMIEQSDNAAGYRLYLDAGGSSGLAAAAHDLGLRHTRIGIADPALTTMGGRDGIQLLRNLVTAGPLDKKSRTFTLHLMRDVENDQRWGVGVVDDDDDQTFANKNGWMSVGDDNGPGEDDDGRWLVNSLGIVRVHGQQLLMAIFTRHDADFGSGVQLVQRLARVIMPTVR